MNLLIKIKERKVDFETNQNVYFLWRLMEADIIGTPNKIQKFGEFNGGVKTGFRHHLHK